MKYFENEERFHVLIPTTGNHKTGQGYQTLYMPKENPVEARRSGRDDVVCGDCPYRANNGCYVAGMMLNSTWKARKDGVIVEHSDLLDAVSKRFLRFGAYGDPALDSVELLSSLAWSTKRHTGYTHQWHKISTDYNSVLMASVDSHKQREEAKSLGYRTYRVSKTPEDIGVGEILCPHYNDDSIRCRDCGLCDGRKKLNDTRKDIVIPAHGAQAKKVLRILNSIE